MRILGLDYGEKTIGVAVSDPLMFTAQGVEIIRRQEEAALRKSLDRLGEIISEYGAEKIVLGYPKNMNNTEGSRCEKTILFKEKLEKNFKGIEVVLQDERLTTVSADRVLIEADMSRKKRSLVVDKTAAVFILQSYLDREQNIKREAYKMNDEFDNEEFDEEIEDEVITLTDEDGNSTDFLVMDVLEHGGKTYILVIESEHADDDEADADILLEIVEEDEEVVYEFLEDEAEFEKISKIFQQNSDLYDIEL